MNGAVNENGSLTELVNSALVGIGDNTIPDLYDANDGRAKLCRLLVNQCIREVQGHPSACWSELDHYDGLVENDKAFAKDSFSYNMPHNCLSIRWVKDEHGRKLPYRITSRSVRTPVPARTLCYVRFSDNPEEWSTELRSCVIGLLSAKLIAAVVKDFSTSRQAVEAFWTMEFPRWAGNRLNKSETALPGRDSEISTFFEGENPRTALHTPDW